MKTISIISSFLLIWNLFAYSQDSIRNNDMASTGIYNFSWFIDPELVNGTTFSTTNAGMGGNGFNNLRISPAFLDSTTRAIETLIGEKIPSQVKCVYRTYKNGKNISTRNSTQKVGGLPYSSKRKAIKVFERDYYANVYMRIGSTKGPIIGDVNGTNVKRLRPNIVLRIKVYNQEKKRVYKNRIRLNNFDRITRFQLGIGGVNMSSGGSLSQEQIAEMVFMAIEALRNK